MNDGDMQVAQWARDGIYVYLVPYFCCADVPEDIFFNYFQNTLALYRLDLRSGKLTTTLQPFKGDVISGYNTSFSPSGKYLAYVVSDSKRDVHIDNLQTGDVFTFTVDDQYVAAGNFKWSQDSNKAIFVAVKAGWFHGNTSINNGVSYFLLDLKTRSSIHLFDQQEIIYRISWTQDGNIILHNAAGDDGLLYDFQHNTFVVVTPTSQP